MIHARDLISPLRRVKGVYYGWWLAGITGLVMSVAGVPLFQSMSVWNPVLRGHFGWTPGQMSLAIGFMRIEGGLLGPMEGLLIERLGSRRMVLIGMLVVVCRRFQVWCVPIGPLAIVLRPIAHQARDG